MYEKQYEIRLSVGESAYEVCFTRMTSFIGNEIDEDYAEDIQVKLGDKWADLEGDDIGQSGYKLIHEALDKWLFDNYPDYPDYDMEKADYLYDKENDK